MMAASSAGLAWAACGKASRAATAVILRVRR
jgi:hypothetical protein